MSRFDVLDALQRRREAEAYEEYRDARRLLELEHARGLMSPEDFHEFARFVMKLADAYYDAQASGWQRFGAEASRLCLQVQLARYDLARAVQTLRASVSLARFRMATHRIASSFLEPAPLRLAYSLTSHGPPRFSATNTESPSG